MGISMQPKESIMLEERLGEDAVAADINRK